MRRGCGCGGCLSKIVIVVVVIFVAIYWGYSSLTLEKLGKADEAGMFGFLGERYEDKSPRDLGIEDLTLREIIEWFFKDDEAAPRRSGFCRYENSLFFYIFVYRVFKMVKPVGFVFQTHFKVSDVFFRRN